jgi:hypothetical protein
MPQAACEYIVRRGTILAEKPNDHSLVVLHLPRQKTEMYVTLDNNPNDTGDKMQLQSSFSGCKIGTIDPVK